MNTPADYARCAAAGMSIKETTEALGVSRSAVSNAAERHGLSFRDARKDPEQAERARKTLRRLRADPSFVAAQAASVRRRYSNPAYAKAHAKRVSQAVRLWHADPKNSPLAALSEDERKDYDILKRTHYTRKEAFAAIGRPDLLDGASA